MVTEMYLVESPEAACVQYFWLYVAPRTLGG
jgi:hypothetical protein